MRAELAVSFLHNPDVIYLDEPTIGMDAIAKERIRQFLTATNRTRNTTILVTSHDMADIEKLCSRVIIIDKGTIVCQGGLRNIRDLYGRERIPEVEFAETYDELDIPFGMVVKDEGIKKSIGFTKDDGTAIELITSLGQRYDITDVSIVEPEIETVIRQIYERGMENKESCVSQGFFGEKLKKMS